MMYLVFALMLVLSVAFIVMPLRRKSSERMEVPTATQLNTQMYKERQAELDADLVGQRISEDQHRQMSVELAKMLIADAGDHVSESHETLRNIPSVVMVMIAVVMAISVGGIYYLNTDIGDVMTWEQHKQQWGPQVDGWLDRKEVIPESLEGQELMDAALVMQQRLQTQTNNAFGWYSLGLAGLRLGQVEHAVISLNRAYQLEPNAATRIAYAQGLLAQHDGKLTDRSKDVLLESLTENPADQRALLLLGFGAFNAERFDDAVWAWKQLMNYVDPGSERASLLERSIQQAEQAAMAAKTKAVDGDAGPVLDVTITLDPALANQVKPDDTLFVFAKAKNGPPMPLAAVRMAVPDFPAVIRLDDSKAMIAGMNLSSTSEVVVSARISKAGDVAAKSGDLQAALLDVSLSQGVQSLSISIDQVVP